MKSAKTRSLVYGLIFAAWATAVLWESSEHLRARKAAWNGLIARGKDVTTTLGVIVRSQRRFAGFVSKESIEAALQSLMTPDDLTAIALLNEAGEVVASAGEFSGAENHPGDGSSFRLFGRTVAITNLVEVGAGGVFEPGQTNPAIVVPRPRFDRDRDGVTNRPAADSPPPGPPPDGPPPGETARDGPRRNDPGPSPEGPDRGGGPPPGDFRGGPPWQRRGGRPSRPPWMSEEEFKKLIQKKGVQRIAVLLSTAPAQKACNDDLWVRGVIAALATVAAAGAGAAWRNLEKSSDLQIRLVRASEMNSHLKELNLAAAGLAHETRNPLNIIRGVAQLVFKQEDLSEETRGRARQIIDEADRVTAQLTEFINYSRPREVRRAATQLRPVIAEVLQTLSCDVEEKQIRASVAGDNLSISADEQMLRQLVFNLILNAVQAAPQGGVLTATVRREPGGDAALEIADNGPGVPVDVRQQIFKPYFTTRPRGSGLGLAVVQKIAAAHGWDVACLENPGGGALFRVSRIAIAG
jgi:signal transduction histidine kinase